MPDLAVAGGLALLVLALTPAAGMAQEPSRQALIVAGAAGGEKFAELHRKWTTSLRDTLTSRYAFPADRVTVLSEGTTGPSAPTRENVLKTLQSYKGVLSPEDILLIILIGHGTFDGASAKFNLVGRDMDATEWKAALDGNPARLIFVNTASSSFPYVEALSGKNRIVITATDTPAQKYATVFPEHFIAALNDEEIADIDKNGRLSVWEAFSFAGQAVKQTFDQKGTLVTERPVMEDSSKGALARTTYLSPPSAAAAAGGAAAELETQRAALEAQLEQLKARKGEMPAGQYEEELERLALELARVSAKIRGGP